MRTPLHVACSVGLLDVVKTLVGVEYGLDVVATKDVYGDTPLAAASKNGHVEIVAFLLSLENGKKSVNVVNNEGKTAFKYWKHLHASL